MKNNLYKLMLAGALCIASATAFSQSPDWEPTGVWPFIHKEFKVANIYTGIFSKSKTQAPANIHVGKMTLWYSANDTLMEAIPGSIVKVEFPNGDTYMPVGSDNRLGRIVQEDTINGRIARVICIHQVDMKTVDENFIAHQNMTQNLLQGAAFLSGVADANAGINLEEEALPMKNEFFFQLGGEIFPVTTKTVLAHINPDRRKEYKVFTRSAEIISTNESSIMKIWNEFFLKY